ncbi:hypothetical protein O3P69_006685 [Scylla paramamosain]|uniref:Uncharacterized protein n=1 Tax=Scylla paramamosain TaxID=85552 RepID=A0AAW0U1E9_SCYPA
MSDPAQHLGRLAPADAAAALNWRHATSEAYLVDLVDRAPPLHALANRCAATHTVRGYPHWRAPASLVLAAGPDASLPPTTGPALSTVSPTMGRVKIKHPRPKELATRSRLLQLLAPTVRVTRLIPTTDSVVVLTASDKDTDSIFQEDVLQKLSSEHFTAILPPELKVQRTVLCSRLDDLVYQYEASDMKKEVERVQTWAKIQEVKEETYIPLLTCNIYYAIEDHSTKQCPCPQGYKVCSECGSNDHTFRESTSPSKQCLHCGQDHSCMAMCCPARKKAYKEKEERLHTESTRSTSISYGQAASTSAPEGPQGLNLIGLVCVMHAHMVNCAELGSFQSTLSTSLAMNGLSDIKLPPNPPSQAIIRAIIGKMSPVQEGPASSQPKQDSSPLVTDGEGYSSPLEEEESDLEAEEVGVENAPSVTVPTQSRRTSSSPTLHDVRTLQNLQNPSFTPNIYSMQDSHLNSEPRLLTIGSRFAPRQDDDST